MTITPTRLERIDARLATSEDAARRDRDDRHAAAVEHLETYLAALELPAVADVAGPILRALKALYDFGAYNFDVDALSWEITENDDRFRDDAERIVRFVEDVATAVEDAVDAFIPSASRAMHPANARAIVLAIFDLDDLRHSVHQRARDAMLHGD